MGTSAPEHRYSVSGLVSLVRGKLEQRFPRLAIEGEASNVHQAPSGHCYFTLKDSRAKLSCVMYRAEVRALPFTLESGHSILARGGLTIFPERGEFQLRVRSVEPLGSGRLSLAFEQLKGRLETEGLFAPGRKRPLPLLPRTIGVVTSTTGAALRDILQVLDRRHSSLRVIIAPTPVQGEGASYEIAKGIDALNRLGCVDVIILSRGGGSLEDLWAFNTEAVARAVVRSTAPVISAVGHETDYTIADFVADLRAPTPSAAAELVARSKQQLTDQVTALNHRLTSAARGRAQSWRLRLLTLASSRGLRQAETLPQRHHQRLDDLRDRLGRAAAGRVSVIRQAVARRGRELSLLDIRVRLDRQRARLNAAHHELTAAAVLASRSRRATFERRVAELDALSPLAILARGYSIVTQSGGRAVRRDVDVSIGDIVDVQLGHGKLHCRIEDKSAGE